MPALLRIHNFAGEIPRMLPRLLQDNYAQEAYHTGLKDGGLTPYRDNQGIQAAPSGTETIYLRSDGTWMTWTVPVNVVPGPVASDRLYITGDGNPQLWVSGTFYPLALNGPGGSLTAATSSTIDPTLQYTVLYTYTYVTEFDEESAPAPDSGGLLVDDNATVNLTGMWAPPDGRGINRIRIYRSQTGSDGTTTFYFIAEIPSTQLSFDDVIASNPIQEVLPSSNYDAAPAGLSGLVAMPNGIMVGFVGKDIWFCEPWIPSAWPDTYVLTTDYPIVGLGVFGSTLVVMTTANPYIVQGTAPENMTMEKLDVNLACVNARSIVDLGYTIAYAGNEGVVTVDANGARLATKTLMTREQWLTYRPDTMQCAQYDGRYMVAYSYVDLNGVTQQGAMGIDFSGDQPFLVRTDEQMTSPYFDKPSGALYFLHASDSVIYRWDSPAEQYKTISWRSKKFVLPGPGNYACILIESVDGPAGFSTIVTNPSIRVSDAVVSDNDPAVVTGTTTATGTPPAGGTNPNIPTNPTMQVTLIADGVTKDVVSTFDKPVRLKGGYMATVFEVQVNSAVPVTAISLANSPAELAGLG